MKEIRDAELLEKILLKHDIKSYFDNKNLDFQLFSYEKGEFLTEAEEEVPYIIFVVEGSVSIYAIRADGTQYTVAENNALLILGDVEFISKSKSLFFAEALTPITAVSLSLKKYENILQKDTHFLNFLLVVFTEKMKHWAKNSRIYSINLEDKLLNYIKNYCPHMTFTNIEKSAALLHCSRRQLQRVLKKLTDENVLIKEKKGKYKLNK